MSGYNWNDEQIKQFIQLQKELLKTLRLLIQKLPD
jgi:hypothetical protein